MGVASVSQQLSVLTQLGHRLPGVTSPQKAATEMVRTLIRLGVAVSVSTVEADQAILVAARAPLAAGGHRLLPPTTSLTGIRIPIDRVPWLNRPVRLRRPYIGPVSGMQTLHSLADDPRPPSCEKLAGMANAWRIRSGSYRVVYTVDDRAQVVTITRVGHRHEFYRRR